MNDIQVGDSAIIINTALGEWYGMVVKCISSHIGNDRKYWVVEPNNPPYEGCWETNLKRIPPLSELESQKETIHESA